MTKKQWRTGEYRKLPGFETQEGYYSQVRDFISEYGKRTKKDMLLFRNGTIKESETGNYGASWTTNANVCRSRAKYLNFVDVIYVMFVPKGTPAVYFSPDWPYEEEYVLDMEAKAENVLIFATHAGEWDLRSDLETDVDIDNWELNTKTMVTIAKRYGSLIDTIF